MLTQSSKNVGVPTIERLLTLVAGELCDAHSLLELLQLLDWLLVDGCLDAYEGVVGAIGGNPALDFENRRPEVVGEWVLFGLLRISSASSAPVRLARLKSA